MTTSYRSMGLVAVPPLQLDTTVSPPISARTAGMKETRRALTETGSAGAILAVGKPMTILVGDGETTTLGGGYVAATRREDVNNDSDEALSEALSASSSAVAAATTGTGTSAGLLLSLGLTTKKKTTVGPLLALQSEASADSWTTDSDRAAGMEGPRERELALLDYLARDAAANEVWTWGGEPAVPEMGAVAGQQGQGVGTEAIALTTKKMEAMPEGAETKEATDGESVGTKVEHSTNLAPYATMKRVIKEVCVRAEKERQEMKAGVKVKTQSPTLGRATPGISVVSAAPALGVSSFGVSGNSQALQKANRNGANGDNTIVAAIPSPSAVAAAEAPPRYRPLAELAEVFGGVKKPQSNRSGGRRAAGTTAAPEALPIFQERVNRRAGGFGFERAGGGTVAAGSAGVAAAPGISAAVAKVVAPSPADLNSERERLRTKDNAKAGAAVSVGRAIVDKLVVPSVGPFLQPVDIAGNKPADKAAQGDVDDGGEIGDSTVAECRQHVIDSFSARKKKAARALKQAVPAAEFAEETVGEVPTFGVGKKASSAAFEEATASHALEEDDGTAVAAAAREEDNEYYPHYVPARSTDDAGLAGLFSRPPKHIYSSRSEPSMVASNTLFYDESVRVEGMGNAEEAEVGRGGSLSRDSSRNAWPGLDNDGEDFSTISLEEAAALMVGNGAGRRFASGSSWATNSTSAIDATGTSSFPASSPNYGSHGARTGTPKATTPLNCAYFPSTAAAITVGTPGSAFGSACYGSFAGHDHFLSPVSERFGLDLGGSRKSLYGTVGSFFPVAKKTGGNHDARGTVAAAAAARASLFSSSCQASGFFSADEVDDEQRDGAVGGVVTESEYSGFTVRSRSTTSSGDGKSSCSMDGADEKVEQPEVIFDHGMSSFCKDGANERVEQSEIAFGDCGSSTTVNGSGVRHPSLGDLGSAVRPPPAVGYPMAGEKGVLKDEEGEGRGKKADGQNGQAHHSPVELDRKRAGGDSIVDSAGLSEPSVAVTLAATVNDPPKEETAVELSDVGGDARASECSTVGQEGKQEGGASKKGDTAVVEASAPTSLGDAGLQARKESPPLEGEGEIPQTTTPGTRSGGGCCLVS